MSINLEEHLRKSRSRNCVAESEDVSVPPSASELSELIAYLKLHRAEPAIVGSVGLLQHLGGTGAERAFRPTHDVDVMVRRIPALFPGWSRDTSSVGVTSWRSPSGGTVDLLVSGECLPSGQRFPRVTVDTESSTEKYPVATAVDLVKMKLASERESDLTDLVLFFTARGSVPVPSDLGKLSAQQTDNLMLIRQWVEARKRKS